MRLILVFFFLLYLLSQSLSKDVLAYDRDVICNDAGCSGFTGTLFSEENTTPGTTVSKSFSVTNERSENISLTLGADRLEGTDDIFTQRIVAVVYEGGSIKFSDTFENFLNTDINLGSLNENETKNYEISISFPSDSGNEYQGKKVNFDITLTVAGEESGSSVVLSSSTSNTTAANNSQQGSILGTILGLSDTGGIKLILIFGGLGILIATIGFIISFYPKSSNK